MGLATYTATWAAIGFGIRCYQLGVMQRPLFTSELLEERREESKIFQEAQKIRNALRKQQQEQLDSNMSH
ncbi:hypothetical protein PGT21_004052 [Puccinia graminis f. sp. tritici]|uniref:Uncharacterized protein n=1 Tax=Puccinia graminis f. sp. tritici TaxID=56615 RepID=A0A5B0MEU5_PUCGR|nr:hypothetical protein PGT21_004052 [Puccinia graminis f. sp. tritici]